jgi:hypothetical protein
MVVRTFLFRLPDTITSRGADTSSTQYQFSLFMNAAYRMITLIRTAMVIIMPLAGTGLYGFMSYRLIFPG